jgi:ribosomal protein S19E (S16A)
MSKLGRPHRSYGSSIAGTVKQLLGLTTNKRSHEANFSRILPKAMDKLVEEGLFQKTKDGYEITPKGLGYLRNLEQKGKA